MLLADAQNMRISFICPAALVYSNKSKYHKTKVKGKTEVSSGELVRKLRSKKSKRVGSVNVIKSHYNKVPKEVLS